MHAGKRQEDSPLVDGIPLSAWQHTPPCIIIVCMTFWAALRLERIDDILLKCDLRSWGSINLFLAAEEGFHSWKPISSTHPAT
jgi:hypothetical protein